MPDAVLAELRTQLRDLVVGEGATSLWTLDTRATFAATFDVTIFWSNASSRTWSMVAITLSTAMGDHGRRVRSFAVLVPPATRSATSLSMCALVSRWTSSLPCCSRSGAR